MISTAEDNRFGSFIKQLRSSRKAGMAQAARAAGLNRSTLHRWEKGETLPRLSELEALLTALEATAQQKKQALALMDAPRAQTQVRQQINRISESLALQSLPHGGDLLRAMRIRKGWTLEDTARRAGVSEWTLRRWEKGTIWPSSPQLHMLCFVLGAAEEELVALTCGHLRFANSNKPAQGEWSVEELEHQLMALFFGMMLPGQRLTELELIGMKRQAWALATRHSRGQHLLAHLHYTHAYYQHTWGNLLEAERLAHIAVDALMEIEGGADFAIHAAVIAACGATYGGNRHAPRKGIAILRPWLSYERVPQVVSWAHSEMALFLCNSGDKSAGLAMSEQARVIASKLSPMYQRRRDYSHADVLLNGLRQPTQALEFLPETEGENPHFTMEVELLRAEALATAGEVSEAHNSVARVQQLLGDTPAEMLQGRLGQIMKQL